MIPRRSDALLLAAALLPAAALPAHAASARRATVPPTYVIDLESGQVRGATSPDLWWQAMTRSDRCLGPALKSRARIATLSAAEYEGADAARLAGLAYTTRCLPHTDGGGALRAGTTFAVRTDEGNFAKVRVRGISARNEIELEWRLYPRPAPGTAAAAPERDVGTLFERAQAALRSGDRARAVPHVDEAVAAVQALPARDPSRIETMSRAGSLYWSARRLDLAEGALLEAVKGIDAAPGAVGAETRYMTLHMLGVVYRDAGKPEQAESWAKRAAAAKTR